MTTTYPVTFNVDYPDRDLDRLTSAFRIVVAIPILAVLSLLTGASLHYVTTNNTTNETATLATGGGVLFLPLVLMIVFRVSGCAPTQPMAPLGEMVAGHSPLHRAFLSRDRSNRGGDHRLVCRPLHRTVPPRSLRLCGGGHAVE